MARGSGDPEAPGLFPAHPSPGPGGACTDLGSPSTPRAQEPGRRRLGFVGTRCERRELLRTVVRTGWVSWGRAGTLGAVTGDTLPGPETGQTPAWTRILTAFDRSRWPRGERESEQDASRAISAVTAGSRSPTGPGRWPPRRQKREAPRRRPGLQWGATPAQARLETQAAFLSSVFLSHPWRSCFSSLPAFTHPFLSSFTFRVFLPPWATFRYGSSCPLLPSCFLPCVF